jgi:hypothetical protein
MSFLTVMFGLCTLAWVGAILAHVWNASELHIPYTIIAGLNLWAAVQCP